MGVKYGRDCLHCQSIVILLLASQNDVLQLLNYCTLHMVRIHKLYLVKFSDLSDDWDLLFLNNFTGRATDNLVSYWKRRL